MRNQPIYDAVINSGGIAGLTSALRIAQEGGRVAIVEPRGALLWEICKARQHIGDLADFTNEPLPSNPVLSQIVLHDTVRNGIVEPVLMEIAADRIAKDAGVDLYFQSRVVGSLEEGDDLQIVLAQKGRMHTLSSRRLVQFIDEKHNAIDDQVTPTDPEMDIYTITFANSSIDKELHTTLNLPSCDVAVRVRPTSWENECYVDIAFPIMDSKEHASELEFAMVYEHLILKLKEQIPALREGIPIYLSDEPWRWRTSAREANVVSSKGIEQRMIRTERVDYTFSWDKCLMDVQQLFVFGEKVGSAASMGTIT